MPNTVPVPLAALAIDGQQPQPGDPVEFTVSGKLDRIEGPIAYVAAETVNGQPLPAGETETNPADMTEAEMRGMAEQADALPIGSP
jgi:hypothetical protein